MPFNTLLLTSLVHGTSVSQKGVNVSVRREKDETILIFKLDSEAVRRNLDIKRDEPICDNLIFYSKEGKTVLCLVELKGNDTRHAVEQIISTYKHLRGLLQERPCWNDIRHIIWKAYVCCNARSSINPIIEYRQELKKLFGHERNFKITHKDEMDNFLRS